MKSVVVNIVFFSFNQASYSENEKYFSSQFFGFPFVYMLHKLDCRKGESLQQIMYKQKMTNAWAAFQF